MRLSGFCMALGLLALAPAALAAPPGGVVVSVVGQLTADGRPLRAGDTLRPGVTLRTGSAASAQLLLAERLSLGLAPSSKLVLARQGDPVLHGGALYLAGSGAVRAATGLQLTLHGGTVLMQPRQVFALGGAATLSTGDRRLALRAGQLGQLRGSGLAAQAGRPSAALLRLARRHAPPPLWWPRLTQGELSKQVRRVARRVERSQARQREMATCGCTEGGGSHAGQVTGPDGLDALEQRQSTVRVRVTGVPKKL